MSDWEKIVRLTNTPLGFLSFGIIIFSLLRKKPHKGMVGGDGDVNMSFVLMAIILAFVIFIILGELGQIKDLTFVKAGGAN